MKPSTQTLERLSALADNELGREEFSIVLQTCKQDESALLDWNNYHLIGEALRSPSPAGLGKSTAFLERFNQRLALEPSIGETRPELAMHSASTSGLPVVGRELIHQPASNDGNFRWKLVAGCASLAAILAVAWNVVGSQGSAAGPQLAQSGQTQQVVVASPQGPIVRDARLEELLAAHKQMGGNSVLQVPSGFLRNATFETPQSTGR